jgi:DNA-binding Xre family transcriptional regulator
MNATKHTKTKQEPEWAREKEITARFGLTHNILYSLRREGKIRSVSLREEGKKYGARLYHVESICQFLASMEAREVKS